MANDLLSIVFTPLVLQSGLICLGAQAILHLTFAYVLPEGPWTKLPSLTAHQTVCLPLMLFLSYRGCAAWFLTPSPPSSSSDADGFDERLFAVRSSDGLDLARIVFGMLAFWDIPVGLSTPALRDGLMVAHHVGMLFVAGIITGVFSGGVPIGSYYGPFFLGAIEVSSVFLCFVDTFHPKHRHWFEWLRQSGDGNGNGNGDRKKEGHFLKNTLNAINESCRILFALSFLTLRALYFPYVMFSTCLPDFWRAGNLPSIEERHGASRAALLALCFVAGLFTVLQMHWGVMVAKQVIKAVVVSDSDDGKGGDSKKKD